MMNLFNRVPWFVATPAALVVTVAMAFVFNYLLSDYFERSFLDEADPLAVVVGGQPEPTGAPAEPTGQTAEPTAAATEASATPADGAPAAEATATPDPGAGVLAEGIVRDGDPGHNGEGVARIIRDAEGNLFLRFEEFSVTNGPDLFVVLSPNADGYADGSLNLGGLKATDGNINYEIPPGTDISQFSSAVVWCRQFDVTFAVAALEEVAM
jgi:hypothetical protein